MKNMTVYVSGAMSGKPDFNAVEFTRAKKLLSNHGYTNIIIPSELPHDGDSWNDYMAKDLSSLMRDADILFLINGGWNESRGVVVELVAAVERGIPILTENLEGEIISLYQNYVRKLLAEAIVDSSRCKI